MSIFLQDCHICITYQDKIGNSRKDCIFGIDEADDAVVLRHFFASQFKYE